MPVRSRIAPTPSGYLHLGNALNFMLTWLWVRKQNGMLRLRIDDRDVQRSRPEFVEDIFATLTWLGMDWDEGPQTVTDHQNNFAQALRDERYHALINELLQTGKVFACRCSRNMLMKGQCNCITRTINLSTPDTALRLNTAGQTVSFNDIKTGDIKVDVDTDMHNFIIRRRDGIPAYQIVSLADDVDFDINLIIRGQDLYGSTAAQLHLVSLLGLSHFRETKFYHHRLITDKHGNKLSKSAGSMSIKAMRQQGLKPQHLFEQLSSVMGWQYNYTSLQQMLEAFNLPA